MNNIILSVLIPTIPSRAKIFGVLLTELIKQNDYLKEHHPSLGETQILIGPGLSFLDGGVSIGKKREGLVQRAEGKYLCFLDDDESIAPNYLETLVRLCNENKDVCTFRSIAKLDNYWTVIDMSFNHPDNEQATPDKIVNRMPWHICAVRTKFAKIHEFPDTNYSEDWEWFSKVLTHCYTEAKTNAIIHQYNHSKINSEADKITNYVQSK